MFISIFRKCLLIPETLSQKLNSLWIFMVSMIFHPTLERGCSLYASMYLTRDYIVLSS